MFRAKTQTTPKLLEFKTLTSKTSVKYAGVREIYWNFKPHERFKNILLIPKEW